MVETPRHVRLARKAALFKRFFDTEDGLQILAEMKQFCHLEDSSYAASQKSGMVDPYVTHINEGKRAVLLHICKLAGLTYHDIERVKTIDEMEMQRTLSDAAFDE